MGCGSPWHSLRQLMQRIKTSQQHLSSFPSIPCLTGFRQVLQGCDRHQAWLACSSSGGSRSSSLGYRSFSDYAAPGRASAAAGLRRVNPSSGAAAGSSAEQAARASTSGQPGSSASILEMQEVPGGSKPLRRWEYYYWGLGATGISFLLYNRLKKPEKTPEELAEAERKADELRVRRKEHVRAVLMGQNFIEGDDDPLEGLSPAQIVMFCEKYGIDPSDPLEGLSPEEIDAYMAQQEAKRQQQQQQQQD